MIILDDLDLDRKSIYINKLFTQGRHYFFTVLMLVQYPRLTVTPQIRSNIDVLFTSKQSEQGVKALYDAINLQFGKDLFQNFIRKNTKNNQFVVFSRFDEEEKIRVVKAVFQQLKSKYNRK